jgi:hypothetical protein
MRVFHVKPLPLDAERVREDLTPEAALQLAAQLCGGTHALSKALGLTPYAAAQWTRCPASRAEAVAALTGVPADKLRGT